MVFKGSASGALIFNDGEMLLLNNIIVIEMHYQ